MSSKPVVSMRELEMESVELLPSRETLCVHKCGPSHTSSYSSNVVANGNGNGNGSILPILNGNILSDNNVNVLGIAWQSQ
jgi:hypothetical protein